MRGGISFFLRMLRVSYDVCRMPCVYSACVRVSESVRPRIAQLWLVNGDWFENVIVIVKRPRGVSFVRMRYVLERDINNRDRGLHTR